MKNLVLTIAMLLSSSAFACIPGTLEAKIGGIVSVDQTSVNEQGLEEPNFLSVSVLSFETNGKCSLNVSLAKQNRLFVAMHRDLIPGKYVEGVLIYDLNFQTFTFLQGAE